MITAGAFLIIESSLSSRVEQAVSLITKEMYSRVEEALALGDKDRAMQEVNTLALAPLREQLADYVEYLTSVAMLFGASRVTQGPGTSVVGMGFEALATTQMANTFLTMITQKAEAYIKETARAYIYPPQVQEVQKADRVLLPFASFIDSAGKAYFDLASSLHTSRVSAYGFTAEAYVLGLVEYQINEQIDNPAICPVCREMHGKTFKVSEARQTLNVVTRVTDPDQLRELQPWPKQTLAAIDELKGMTTDELVAKNWHIPPFHPRCRGLLIRAGKAPSLEAISAGTVQEKYVSTKEDFAALKVSANPDQLKKWNAFVGLSPAEVVARLSGKKVDEFLAGLLETKKPRDYAGLTSLSIGKNISIRMSAEGFGSAGAFDQAVKIIPETKSLWLSSLDMVDEGTGTAKVAKAYMREFYALAKDMELEKLGLVAGLDAGGYAWAKYGFAPDAAGWSALKADIAAKLPTLTNPLTSTQQTACAAILESNDPLMIFALADSTFGKKLLMGTTWVGELDLSDAESVTRFLTYIGGLK